MNFEYNLNCYKQLSTPFGFFIVVGLLLVFQSRLATADDLHACDYLTVDEVTQVMGFEVSLPERKPANPMGQSICFFDAPQEQGMRFAQLQLVTSSSEKLKKLGFTATSLFQNNMGFLENPLKVGGIGEQAFWGGSGIKMGAGLHVYYKDVTFSVLANAANEEDSLAKSKKLAGIIIGKIK